LGRPGKNKLTLVAELGSHAGRSGRARDRLSCNMVAEVLATAEARKDPALAQGLPAAPSREGLSCNGDIWCCAMGAWSAVLQQVGWCGGEARVGVCRDEMVTVVCNAATAWSAVEEFVFPVRP
jgi:hypothetical protein